ncbi:MAG: serine/threonine-protein kinase [Pleurocapsa sp. MO_226.B13]|nr:serine/threonine-protein kinase [Pleurocapsa sp. MO_226.B13]
MKGKIIQNKYQIIQILGQDTFSETFLARDKGWYSSHRYVIKKFRPILGNSQAEKIKQLFYREAEILKLLSGKNPQIPQLYEYFTEGEDFYLVREWIQGITLEQKVQQQGILPETEVRQILASILSVLQYIHNHGIVYCQLKPSSIVLRQQSSFARHSKTDIPVPIYFGGVKELEKKVEQLNQRNLVLANQPEYIPPEQERGQSVYASDLYSLGLTAIYLLTGKTPAELNFEPENNCLLWQREVPNLTTDLVRVINRAIYPNTSDRFSDPEEMLQALNSRSVTISESLVTQTEPKSWLTSEVKITAILFFSGLGVIGLMFVILNFNFTWSFRDSTERKSPADVEIEALSHSLEYIPDVSSAASLDIPTFRVGTPQERIIRSLGKPTQSSLGYWKNSRALVYSDFVPARVDLGYLTDLETGIVRQTEVSFADSVKPIDIHQTIKQLLLNNYSAEIEKKINQVFLETSTQEQFEVEHLKGVIQRNPQDRIYIAIWEAGFHQLER